MRNLIRSAWQSLFVKKIFSINVAQVSNMGYRRLAPQIVRHIFALTNHNRFRQFFLLSRERKIVCNNRP